MLIGLMSDSHDRVPAIVSCSSGWSSAGRDGAARGRLLLSVFARAVSRAQRADRRRLRPQRRRPRGAQSVRGEGCRHRALRVAAQLRGRRSPHPPRPRLGEVHERSLESHEIIVHGFTHTQEIRELNAAHLIVNPGEACGWLYRHARRCHPRPRHEARRVHLTDGARVEGVKDSSRILILDYGSQFTQFIARRVREARVYSEIHPPTRSVDWIREWKPTGIILSGGPNSVYGEDVPSAEPALLDVAPVLGICYGMQLIAHLQGGAVIDAGQARVRTRRPRDRGTSRIIRGLRCRREDARVDESRRSRRRASPGIPRNREQRERRDRRDASRVEARARAFSSTPKSRIRARGADIISNFVFNVCGARPSWTPGTFIDEETARIRARVGTRASSADCPAASTRPWRQRWCTRRSAISSRASSSTPGLLRLHERDQVERTFRANLGIDLITVSCRRSIPCRPRRRRGSGEETDDHRPHVHRRLRRRGGERRRGRRVSWCREHCIPDVIESASPRGGPR